MSEIVECPYMPDGFIAMKDDRGTVVANLKTGHVFRIPPVEFELKMPETLHVEGDRIFGTIAMTWRFSNA